MILKDLYFDLEEYFYQFFRILSLFTFLSLESYRLKIQNEKQKI